MQRVVRSTIIDAPIERVWAVLRDFNSHDRWHRAIETSRVEGGERSDQVGCVRSFTLKDGHRIREQLLTLSDTEHTSTYCIVEATVPLQRYVATVTLKPVTDGSRTFWHWESTFSTPPGMERELHDMVAEGVYEAGFEDLRKHLDAGTDQRAVGSDAMPSAVSIAARRMALRRYGMEANLRLTAVIGALKLILHPAIVFILGFKILHLPEVWAGVAVLFAAAPTGINCYLFAARYKTGEAMASSAIAVTTVLSLFSTLFWLWMLGIEHL